MIYIYPEYDTFIKNGDTYKFKVFRLKKDDLDITAKIDQGKYFNSGDEVIEDLGLEPGKTYWEFGILLKREEVKECYDFAEEAWGRQSQSKKHFGLGERTKEEFVTDQTEGKMAELVLMKFLKQMGLTVNLDFEHYEGEH